MGHTPLELQLMKENAELRAEIAALREELAQLKRMLFGKKSEKIPSVSKEFRASKKPSADEESAAVRKPEVIEVRHEVAATLPEDQRRCPHCHQLAEKPLGEGKVSTVQDYVPVRFVLYRHVRQTVVCPCGKHIVTAPVPVKPFEKSQYGAGFIAHMVVEKCADAIPLNRLASMFRRQGADISVSSMNDQFHQAAQTIAPLAELIEQEIAKEEIVQADETPLKMKDPHTPASEKAQTDGKKKSPRGYSWVFLSDRYALYKYSSRSGDTPVQVLGGSSGTLVVDAYSGYNEVTQPDGRQRAGCLAHVRRKFFEARLAGALIADQPIGIIREIYRVEHEAREKDVQRTEAHLQMRQARAAPLMAQLHAWLQGNEDMIPPQSALGKAIAYALNQWDELNVFLTDARIPVDNNASERALRKVALGRKNWLFVGNPESGENYATLMTLVSTCELNGVNPEEYLRDVLLRIHTTPLYQLADLLPHNWRLQPAAA